jgi:uncharacterized Fe-S cluster-containing MiaB family protein
MRQASLLIVALLAAAGCRNSCQQICVRMADYADECGFSVPDDQLAACIDEQASGLEKEDRQACRDFGTPEAIRNEWTCDELARYWGSDEAGDDAR